MGVNHIFRAHSRAPPAQWVKIHSEKKIFLICLLVGLCVMCMPLYLVKVQISLIRDMVVERCNRQFCHETIHPTKKFTSMDLLQMSWHTYFWPPWRLLEAKHHTATAHFGTLTQCSVHPTVPKCAVAVWCLASNSLNGGQK